MNKVHHVRCFFADRSCIGDASSSRLLKGTSAREHRERRPEKEHGITQEHGVRVNPKPKPKPLNQARTWRFSASHDDVFGNQERLLCLVKLKAKFEHMAFHR